MNLDHDNPEVVPDLILRYLTVPIDDVPPGPYTVRYDHEADVITTSTEDGTEVARVPGAVAREHGATRFDRQELRLRQLLLDITERIS